MKKPAACKDCPMYGDGTGFVPDEIVPNSKVFVMLPSPSVDDAYECKPSMGKTGYHYDNTLLPMAGLTRGVDVSTGHIIKCCWKNPYTGVQGNLLPSQIGAADSHHKVTKKQGITVEQQAIAHCLKHHTTVTAATKVVVSCGDMTWKALGQDGTLDTWRGWLGDHQYLGKPVFGTYPPVYIKQQPRMAIPMMSDWKRIKQFVDGSWPVDVPEAQLVTAPRFPYIESIRPEEIRYVTLDTEYTPGTYEINLIGVAYWGDGVEPLAGDQIQVSSMNWAVTTDRLSQLIRTKPVVMHNALADIMALNKTFGFDPTDYGDIQDTIQLHALLQSEWPHDLGFLESMHSPHRKMKHLSQSAHLLYNWGDCLTTGYAYQTLMQWMKRDPQSYSVYTTQNVPLITTRFRAKKRGIMLDRKFLAELSQDLQQRCEGAQQAAEGYTGFPLNLGSDVQIGKWLIDVERMKLRKKRGATRATVDKDAIADLRRKYYDFDPDVEKNGITPEMLYHNIHEGGHPLLESRAAYQNAATLYSSWVTPFLNKKYGNIKGQLVFEPKDFINWVSADQSTHSQASGRWSVTGPALTTLPYKLRGMLRPPEGYVMVKYDADQQELRLSAHLCKDEPTLLAFTNKWDVHTLNVCDIFKLDEPPEKGDPHGANGCLDWRNQYHWEGKDDKRRVFAKRFVYRLLYRGDPRSAGDIPGAKALGLVKRTLVEASENYLQRHPALPAYWKVGDAEICASRVVRSFSGRKRFLNGDNSAPFGTVSAICREGTNHRMQSGGVDWSNLNILTIERECRDLGVEFVYGSFDSHNWFVPVEHEHEFRQRVLEITQRPWVIDGRELTLPITLDPTIYPL